MTSEAVPLGALVGAVDTWNPSKSRTSGTFTYLDLSSVDQARKVIADPTTMSVHGAPSRARQLVAAGDVLVATVRPNLNSVALVTPDLDGATASTGFCVLRPGAGLDVRYLFHWVRSSAFVSDMVRQATGASYPAVSDRIIKESRIPLPSVPEQRRIAELLDRVDDLRAKRRAALTCLDGLTQSIFLDMFGLGPDIIRWPTGKLGDHLDFMTSGSRGWAAHYAEDGCLFLRIQNVVRGELDLGDAAFVHPPQSAEAKRTRVEAGDVLLSITADLGRVAVVPESLPPAYINQHLSILRTKQFEPRFLATFLGSSDGRRQLLGRNRHGVKAGLNFDDIRSVVIPMPPRALQREFSERIAYVDDCRAEMRGHAAELASLQSSLQQRAFSGEL